MLRALAHPPTPLGLTEFGPSPPSAPRTHIQVVLQGLGGHHGGSFFGEVLAGWVEGVLLQVFLQQAMLNQGLPQGLLSGEGDPVAEYLKMRGLAGRRD